MVHRFKTRITTRALIFAAFLFLLVPLPWLAGWLIAAFVHELFHCIALFACGKRIDGITVDLSGARIQTGALTYGQTVFCALAGPVGGLLLVDIAARSPHITLCALLQSAYNLIPLPPLDGGRALHSLIHLIAPERMARTVCMLLGILSLSGIFFLCCIAAFNWNLGFYPFFLFLILALRIRK